MQFLMQVILQHWSGNTLLKIISNGTRDVDAISKYDWRGKLYESLHTCNSRPLYYILYIHVALVMFTSVGHEMISTD